MEWCRGLPPDFFRRGQDLARQESRQEGGDECLAAGVPLMLGIRGLGDDFAGLEDLAELVLFTLGYLLATTGSITTEHMRSAGLPSVAENPTQRVRTEFHEGYDLIFVRIRWF